MLKLNSNTVMLTHTHAYLEEDDVIKHEKESGWKTGIFVIKLVCRALAEDLGRRHDAREMWEGKMG